MTTAPTFGAGVQFSSESGWPRSRTSGVCRRGRLQGRFGRFVPFYLPETLHALHRGEEKRDMMDPQRGP